MLGPTIFLVTFIVLSLNELLFSSKAAQAEEAEQAKPTPEEELEAAIARFLKATQPEDAQS